MLNATLTQLHCPSWCTLEWSDHEVLDPNTPAAYVLHKARIATGRQVVVEISAAQTAAGLESPEIMVSCDDFMSVEAARELALDIAQATSLARSAAPVRMSELPPQNSPAVEVAPVVIEPTPVEEVDQTTVDLRIAETRAAADAAPATDPAGWALTVARASARVLRQLEPVA